MTSFTDKTGAAWDLEITVATAIKLKARLGVDLGHVADIGKSGAEESLLDRLGSDIALLFSVIYAVCEEKVKAAGLTEEQFAARFSGDTVEAATEALLDEIVNFTPPASRKVLAEIRRICRAFQEQADEKLTALVTSQEFKQEILRELNK